VTILEGESAPGLHASGRNAGLVASMLETDPDMLDIAVRGARMLREAGLTTVCGSVLLVDSAEEGERVVARATQMGVPARMLRAADLVSRIPWIAGSACGHAVLFPEDGKVDPAVHAKRLLDEAKDAGVRVVTGARVTSLRLRGERITGVETTAGFFEASLVVDAAGAWAGAAAMTLGEGRLTDLGIAAFRRHLFSAPIAGTFDASCPWVWDLDHSLYFRVDPAGLTLSACDDTPHEPGMPEMDPAAAVDLAGKLAVALPAAARLACQPLRACLRTWAPDRRFVIGPDPRLPGFFWVAALGGAGVTAGLAVGELAAALLLGRDVSPRARAAFDPARLVGPV
jgi:glycine/D-amino acid oxidase-like deaminating enzyme